MAGAVPISPICAVCRATTRTSRLIKLEQNYRSTVRILKAANALISHNEKLFDKKLWSELGPRRSDHRHTCPDKEKEAESVVMKLQAHRFRASGRIP
jgi:ATP-dependent DNA helicase Rep